MTAAVPPRPVSAFVHGPHADIVIIPARVAAWLDSQAHLSDLRVKVRGNDPEVDNVLAALRLAALSWRTSATGSDPRQEPEVEQPSVMSTTQVADQLGVTDRTVRLAITEKRLEASQVAGRWQITRESFEHYRAARNARAGQAA